MTPAAPERPTYVAQDPIKQGEDDVKVIENDTTKTAVEKKTEIENTVKRDILTRSGFANSIRILDAQGGRVEDNSQALNVTKSVSMFLYAAEQGHITPPPPGPTRALYDSLVTNLRRYLDTRVASYVHPLILGVLQDPNYVRFEGGGSQFEQDLSKIVAGYEEDYIDPLIRQIFDTSALSEAEKRTIRNSLNKNIQEKRKVVQRRRKESRYSDQEQVFLDEMFENDDSPFSKEIKKELLPALLNAQAFHKYYKDKYNKILTEKGSRGIAINTETEHQARREATMHIHKCFMYLSHRIFSQVIENAGHQNWQQLNQATGRGYGITAEQIFRNVKRRLLEIQHDVPLFGDFNFRKTTNGQLTPENSEKKEAEIFYQLGSEKIKQWDTTRDTYGNLKYSEVRDIPVISSELEQLKSFKEFVERFNTALDAEHDLLEVGINFNYLLNTGHIEQQGATFFKQAASYAEHSLRAGRIDELYRLPYNEVVHAARIELANHLKRQMAMNKWLKNPDMFKGLFHHANTAEHHVLIDMIRSHLGNDDVPEWAIRRALIHARMHMSLISLDYHAISSYGHPYLTDKLKPTFTDTAMARLETFNTWWDATKWQTTELFRYGLAFMPAANRQWMQEVWLPADVQQEGVAIWENSKNIGKLSLVGRRYFNLDTPLNIMELNPMGVGGVEKQSGWGIKYPYTPWIDDFIDYPTSHENFHMQHKETVEGKEVQTYRDMELAWKRLENLGIEILKNFKDTYLFGYDDNFLKLEGGKVKYTEHYRKFFVFLFERYFKEDIGNEALSLKYRDKDLIEQHVQYSDFESGEDFWKKVVEPILNRQDIIGRDGNNKEPASNAAARNLNERRDLLKNIIDQALGVIMFERLPVDMVLTEDPLRSQNGKTFLEELQDIFLTNDPHAHGGREHNGKMNPTVFEHTLADLAYVQSTARTRSVAQIKDNLSQQRVEADSNHQVPRPEFFSTYGRRLSDFDQLRSTITISDAQIGASPLSKTGFIIDEHIVRDLLTEKYNRILSTGKDTDFYGEEGRDHAHQNIENAVRIYREIRDRMAKKPDHSHFESNCEELVTDDWAKREIKFGKNRGDLEEYEQTREILDRKKDEIKARLKQEFKKYREETMKTRLAWSGAHLLDLKVSITINDVAYPFMYFSSTGDLLVQRRLDQIAGTQEQYKNYIMGEYDSHLKKYYRKEDQEELLKSIIEVRNRIKEWLGPEDYNGISMFITENSINVMRIRSDAENALVDMQFRMEHKRRAAISGVATEGDEHPLRRQDRYKFITEFMHMGQYPKHTDPKNYVYEVSDNPRTERLIRRLERWGPGGKKFGEFVASVANTFFGPEEAKVIRREFKEQSGNALRLREIANLADIFRREGPSMLLAIFAALLILNVVKGYQAAEE